MFCLWYGAPGLLAKIWSPGTGFRTDKVGGGNGWVLVSATRRMLSTQKTVLPVRRLSPAGFPSPAQSLNVTPMTLSSLGVAGSMGAETWIQPADVADTVTFPR